MMAGKDIIFFLSSGNVNILESHHIIQKIGHKPDNVIVATMLLGSLITEQIATWIIILSIFLGNLLLILLILILFKIGFFKRKKKRELEILKSENVSFLKHFNCILRYLMFMLHYRKKHKIILETCSLTEVFHQE